MTAQQDEVDSHLNADNDERMAAPFKHGVSRRDVMRTLLASGLWASPAGGMLAHAASSSPAPKKGGRIKIASISGSATDTLDPAKGSGITDYTRTYMFYNGLTRLDEKLVPQMELAESIENEGALRWTIKLRKDVHFHDGKPFTAADVVYSLLRHQHAATRSKVQQVAEQMAEVKVASTHEVRIKLSSPNADLPVILGTTPFLIVKEGTTDFSTAIGTGPYKCKEFKSNAVANESGWKNEKFDQLLIAARAQTNEAKRKRLYADMQVLVHEHAGVGIPLFNSTVDGYNTNIKGYGAHPLGGFM